MEPMWLSWFSNEQLMEQVVIMHAVDVMYMSNLLRMGFLLMDAWDSQPHTID